MQFSLNNLKRRKLRSWLTMIGIFIGIAAVVALISLGQGLQDFITSEFESLGGDKIMIQSKTIGPPGSATSKELILTSKDLTIIKNVRGVEDAAGILMKTTSAKSQDERNIGLIIGYDDNYEKVLGKNNVENQIVEGRGLEEGDKSKVIVGNNHVNGDIWDKQLKLRDTIEIEGKEFKIVGVMKKTGSPFEDNAYFVRKETLKELLNVQDEESQITVKVAKNYDPEEVADAIKRKLRQSRGEKEGEETFSVQTSEQLLQSFSNIFSIVQGVLVGIAAISLLVGGVGIMNTMYTSVLERTKEIGVMKAIGATNNQILFLFLIESGLLGLVGGLIGIGLGIGLAKAAELIAGAAIGTPLLKASINPSLIIGALCFSIIIGGLSGIFPAKQASNLKPVDALRYE